MLLEPENKYLTHFTTRNGTSKTISENIINIIEDRKNLTNHIRAVGSDATVVNTGNKSGYTSFILLTITNFIS